MIPHSVLVERAGLVRGAIVGDADLPRCRGRGPQLEEVELHGVEAEGTADVEGEVDDPPRVVERVVVIRLESVRESLHRGEEGLLEVVERARVLDRELRLVGDAGEEAHRPWREALRVHGDDATDPGALEVERRDRIDRIGLEDAVNGRELLEVIVNGSDAERKVLESECE